MITFGVSLRNMGFGNSGADPITHRDQVLAIAEQSDELGFDTVWAGDHLSLHTNPRAPYPYSPGEPYWIPSDTPILDPLATVALLAGRTQRVKLGFGVLVVPYRHPLITAKIVATIDVFSNGRVILGVGAGWYAEEFEATGADYEKRGPITDDYIGYFREAFSNDYPDFRGEFFQLTGMSFLPRPIQPRLPIWVGGNTRPAMRRAARFGDGWDTLGIRRDQLEAEVGQMKRLCEQHGRDIRDLTICVRGINFDLHPSADRSPNRPPLNGSLEQVLADIRWYEKLGIGHMILGTGMPGWDAAAMLQRTKLFAREIMPQLG